ncbi:MAG: PepSY domain-containing protein [Planctomycetes bacterium]|nr:PepSY domain-containing protein [Planctomycetota bacterium]
MSRTRSLLPSLLTLALLALYSCESACPVPDSASKPTAQPAAPPAAKPAELPPAAPTAPAIPAPKTTLANAIAVALASAKDTRFFGAEYESGEDRQIYSVALVGGGSLHEIRVDVADGKILGADEEKLDEHKLEIVEGMFQQVAKTTVDQALAAALAQVPGSWAAGAGLTRDGEATRYGVLLVTGEGTKLAIVSAEDAKVLEVRTMAHEDEDEDEDGEEMEMDEGSEGGEEHEKPEAPK